MQMSSRTRSPPPSPLPDIESQDGSDKSDRRRSWRRWIAAHKWSTVVLVATLTLLLAVTLLFGTSLSVHVSLWSPARSSLLPTVANAALPAKERRELFELSIAQALLRLPAVNCAVDELLKRVRHLIEAVASRSTEGVSDLDSDGAVIQRPAGEQTTAENMLQFAFGTRDRTLTGSVGWELRYIRRVLDGGARPSSRASPGADEAPMAGVKVSQPTVEVPNLDVANLREKLTLLYIATMQPTNKEKEELLSAHDALTAEEKTFYSLQSDSRSAPTVFPMSLILSRELGRWQARPTEYEQWMRSEGVSLELVTLAMRARLQLADGSVHAVHQHQLPSATEVTAPYNRKCFIPLFVPPPDSAVRMCRCIDTELEMQEGCRRVRDRWKLATTRSAEEGASAFDRRVTAADISVPHLSRREIRFALPGSAQVASNPLRLSVNDRRVRDLALIQSPFWTQHPLPWIAGEDVFEEPAADSTNPIFVQLRELIYSSGAAVAGARFVAGPSSTVSSLLSLAQYMDMGRWEELALLRLALVAYLVPARDHSLIEILLASEPFDLQPSLQSMRFSAAEDRDKPDAAEHFATALPITHLMHASMQVPHYCSSSGTFTELTSYAVHDAMALEVLKQFAPLQTQQAAAQAAEAADAPTPGRCSSLLAAFWQMLELDVLHATHCKVPDRSDLGLFLHGCSSEEVGAARHSCNPTAMLQFLARQFYA
jgi:hypothetical protein